MANRFTRILEEEGTEQEEEAKELSPDNRFAWYRAAREEAQAASDSLPGPIRQYGKQAGNAVGQAVRYGVGGALKFPLSVADMALNAAVPGAPFNSASLVDKGADALGLPRALDTPAGRTTEFVGEALGGAGGLVKLGQKVGAGLAPLAENAWSQLIGNTTGGLSASAAREAGAGPVGQMFAGLAGGAGPTVLAQGGRRALTGNQNRQQMQSDIDAFERSGAGTPTAGQVLNRGGLADFERTLADTPLGGRVGAARGAQMEGIRQNVRDRIQAMSPTQSRFETGQAVESGVKGWIDQSAELGELAYDEALKMVNGNIPVPLTKTMGSGPLAPASTAAPRTMNFLRGDFLDQLGKYLNQDVKDYLKSVAQTPAGNTNALPFDTVRALRTAVGRRMEDSLFKTDAAQSDLKQLWGSLSDDLEAGVQSARISPNAKQALNQANTYWRQRSEDLRQIGKAIGEAADSPEKWFRAVSSNAQDGPTYLAAVMRKLNPQQRDILRSRLLYEMTEATPGVATQEGQRFSLQSMFTRYDNMAPEVKSIMFEGQPDLKQAFDTAARVASRMREQDQMFGSTSRSARSNQLMAMGLSGTQSVSAAGRIMGLAASTSGLSRLLSKPEFVYWLAKGSNVPEQAALNYLQTLTKIGNEIEDRDIIEFAESAMTALEEAY